ncbi:MAG: permease-like cell division protein FtsX [Sterolibacterium sp.]|nr:permease-like cell division protein FtsX [Sterolibacterium sp.]
MNAWLTQHLQALHWAWQRLAATPMNSLLSLLAIGIALALPAGGQMLLDNSLQFVRATFSNNDSATSTAPQISLFMRLTAERSAAEAITQRLQKHPAVKSAHFVSREDTLKRMQADPGLREIIASLPDNPYPDAFIINPQDDRPDAMEALRSELATWPQVEHVQLDAAWVRRLDAMLRLGRLAVALLTGLLGAGLIAITFTTLRLQILARRSEIEGCRLLGATDAYIRRPFYYFGFLQGLAGGIVAWLIVFLITQLLRGPIAELAQLYDATLILHPLTSRDTLLLLAISSMLGWFGAALSLRRYLHDDSL